MKNKLFFMAMSVCLLAFGLVLASCDNGTGTGTIDNNNPSGPTGYTGGCVTDMAVSGADVYFAGYVSNGSADKPVYWKNGTLTALSFPLGRTQGRVTDMAVSGADVYFVGNTANIGGTYPQSVYWKNGTPTALPSLGGIKAIVVSGADVYTIGSSGPPELTYWKNGTSTSLYFTGLNGGQTQGYVNAMAVSGADVYVAGYATTAIDFINPEPRYWKNGTCITLPPPTGYTKAFVDAIEVSGADVYFAGYVSNGSANKPVYWKNEINPTFLPLPAGYTGAYVSAIAVSGADVYFAGSVGVGSVLTGPTTVVSTNKPVYWKNGTLITLPLAGYTGAYVSAIAVSGADVYVAGTSYEGSPIYWKNGTLTTLPFADYTHPL
ncbi:hypothetical protein ACYULU_11320 [Breznakiellaceae bacterium SP9]